MRSGLLSSSSLLSNDVPAVHNSMAIVDQTSSFLGSLGKLNYIKYYSLSISKVYSMWTLLTTSLLPPYGSRWLLNDMLQNCWLSDKVTVILYVESKFLRKNLFLLNRLPVPPPTWCRRGASSFFSACWKIYMFVVPSYQVEDLKIVTLQKISTLSLSQSSQC